MNRSRIPLEIQESAEEIRKLYRSELDRRKSERLHFLYLIKTEQVRSVQQASALLMHHRHTLTEWIEKYEQGGLAGLLKREETGGRTPSVSAELRDLLEERLNGDGFNSYKEALVFMKEHGFPSDYNAARHYLKKYHNVRMKTARPQHLKQNPESREDFKKILLNSSVRATRAIQLQKSTSTSRTKPDLEE